MSTTLAQTQTEKMSASSSTLNEAAKIKPFQERDDWIEWDEKLQGQLDMIDLLRDLDRSYTRTKLQGKP